MMPIDDPETRVKISATRTTSIICKTVSEHTSLAAGLNIAAPSDASVGGALG